jgi:hypothetical protein
MDYYAMTDWEFWGWQLDIPSNLRVDRTRLEAAQTSLIDGLRMYEIRFGCRPSMVTVDRKGLDLEDMTVLYEPSVTSGCAFFWRVRRPE